MATPKLTPAVVYRAIFLAFGLVVAGLIFEQLATLVLAEHGEVIKRDVHPRAVLAA